jgi:hypothetical protein
MTTVRLKSESFQTIARLGDHQGSIQPKEIELVLVGRLIQLEHHFCSYQHVFKVWISPYKWLH